MTIIGFSIAIMFIIAVGLGVWLAIIMNKEQEDPMDFTLVLNLNPEYSENSGFGTIIQTIKGTKRIGFRFAPKDVDVYKLMKDKKQIIKIPIVWIPEENIVQYPKGFLLPNRNFIIIMPGQIEDLPEQFRNSAFGKTFASIVQDKQSERTVLEIMRSSNEMKDILLKLVEGGDRITEYLELDRTLTKDILDKVALGREDKNKGFGLPQPGGFRGGNDNPIGGI